MITGFRVNLTIVRRMRRVLGYYRMNIDATDGVQPKTPLLLAFPTKPPCSQLIKMHAQSIRKRSAELFHMGGKA